MEIVYNNTSSYNEFTVTLDYFINYQSDFESIPLIAETCIGGYTFGVTEGTHNHRTCQCDRSVSDILLCEDDQDSIIIEV